MHLTWPWLQKWIGSWEKIPKNIDESLSATCTPRLSSLRLKTMMLPRSDIVAIDHNASFQEVTSCFLQNRFEALPVFRETLDQVIGIIDIHTVLEVFREGGAWIEKIRPALFAAASMEALEAVLEMQKHHLTFILIVDEYGGIDGLVSRDEILSALMEHLKLIEGERKEDEATYQEDGGLLLDGRLSLERFQELVGKDFPQEAVDPDAKIETTGGLVSQLAGRLPLKGEILSHPSGITFEVVDADPRKVKKLLVRFPALKG
jgi:magnesium and cobalt transporter